MPHVRLHPITYIHISTASDNDENNYRLPLLVEIILFGYQSHETVEALQ